jgi:hypothetical protein
MPFCQQLAADIVSNDSAGVRALFETYNQAAETTAREGWTIEARNSRQWLRDGGGRPEDIATRRQAVQSRGKSQAG